MVATRNRHLLAGKTVTVNAEIDGMVNPKYRIEDWWENLGSGSWMHAVGNPAALKYTIRSAFANLPMDDEVVYGKIGGFGHIVHVSELGDVVEKPEF